MAHTNIVNSSRLETLSKDNYDTWRIQVEALLIKNDTWGYVCDEKKKPEIIAGNAASKAAHDAWTNQDRKAKSDLILSINPSELKQIRGCVTSKEVWEKLENVYMSKGPRRMASLLKQITQQKLQEGEDVREHLSKFFDAVGKLEDMDVNINDKLLTIMILNSLPNSFENFRCAIETRDILPDADDLKVKILDEYNTRKQAVDDPNSGAMFAKPHHPGWKSSKGGKGSGYEDERKQNPGGSRVKYKCGFCGKQGHKEANCFKKKQSPKQHAKFAEETYFINSAEINELAKIVDNSKDNGKWCLDSGYTPHLCNDKASFTDPPEVQSGLKLASNPVTQVKAKGDVKIMTSDGNHSKSIKLENTLYVPDLRINLMSVAKIVDKKCEVLFTQECAFIQDLEGNVKMVADREGDLFYLRSGSEIACTVSSNKSSKAIVWHERLGHLNSKDMATMLKNHRVIGLDFKDDTDLRSCKSCIAGKLTSTPFPKRIERSPTLLNIVYTDLCGLWMKEPLMKNGRENVPTLDTLERSDVRFSSLIKLRTKTSSNQKPSRASSSVIPTPRKRIAYGFPQKGRSEFPET